MTKKRDVAADAEAALLEMVEDFRGTGLMSEDTYQRITMRQVDPRHGVRMGQGKPDTKAHS